MIEMYYEYYGILLLILHFIYCTVFNLDNIEQEKMCHCKSKIKCIIKCSSRHCLPDKETDDCNKNSRTRGTVLK